MLSRALIETAQAETVSARLGETGCTVDVSVPGLSESAVAKAESLVNSVIDDDVFVRAFFPTESELAALPLRRRPKVSENIRVVEIGAFDVSPCGGTHCVRTAQIGMVRVTGLERYKGMMRVTFQAGPAGRADAFLRARVLETLAQGLSTSPEQVPESVDKLRAELKAAREERRQLVGRMAEMRAAVLVAEHAGAPVIASIEDGVDTMRAVAERVVALGVPAFLACRTPDGTAVLLARPAASPDDCAGLLKALTSVHGGKGGGKPERAEGRLSSGVTWPDAMLSVLKTPG
jgi:alanyl-tRNA synthetase